jgi:5'-nucleotidase
MMTRLFVTTALLCLSAPVSARNIVLTNDDGLTSNVKALYDALKAEGHDVIVSVPCSGQSGMGAAVKFMRPLSPLAADCLNGAARKGDPGAGRMTRAGFGPDWYYVDGTPVMALLYGLDVVAQARWGKAPDLVLSGPNEGQNVGFIVISSGTVSNAQYGAIRGIPSVALSAGANTVDHANLANPNSAKAAQLSVALVKALEARAKGKALLPPGTALNVNFPDRLEGARWRFARIGTYNGYKVGFMADMGATPAGKALGLPALPGIAVGPNEAAPAPAEQQDESVVYKQDIAVSVMQIGYEASPARQSWLRQHLKGLFGK